MFRECMIALIAPLLLGSCSAGLSRSEKYCLYSGCEYFAMRADSATVLMHMFLHGSAQQIDSCVSTKFLELKFKTDELSICCESSTLVFPKLLANGSKLSRIIITGEMDTVVVPFSAIADEPLKRFVIGSTKKDIAVVVTDVDSTVSLHGKSVYFPKRADTSLSRLFQKMGAVTILR